MLVAAEPANKSIAGTRHVDTSLVCTKTKHVGLADTIVILRVNIIESHSDVRNMFLFIKS